MFGWGFRYSDISPWESWFTALISDPFVISTELLGIIALVSIFVVFRLNTKENFMGIIKTGKITK
jgi:hypothetical protein